MDFPIVYTEKTLKLVLREEMTAMHFTIQVGLL